MEKAECQHVPICAMMSVFLWLRKQRPRFAQGQLKGYFQMKELDRTTIRSYCRGEWEMRSSCRQPVGIRQLVRHERDVLQLTSCSNLRQPIIHSPHHVLETFRPFLVKVTGAAQSDFGLVQLQVNRKLLLNWICLGVPRNRLYHTAGPVQLMQPNFPCGQLSKQVR